MTPEEMVAAAAGLDGASVDASFGDVTVDVPAEGWTAGARWVRDELGCGYFDWLSAYDDGDAGLAVVLHAWSVEQRHGVLLRTRVPREAPSLPTLVDVWAGADWHERETAEMFGVTFTGHPNLVPLLLPDGFEGHPLRKEFVLASRVAKAWPGAKEPGESDADVAHARRKVRAPGVPDSWGPAEPATAGVEGEPA